MVQHASQPTTAKEAARREKMQSISQFLSEEQDEVAVRKILPKITELLTKEEAIDYIAVQKKLVVNISPDAVVLTNKRIIFVQPSLFGMKFQDFPWREVQDVHMSEQNDRRHTDLPNNERREPGHRKHPKKAGA
jgi:hypothetical protein